jgi:uncharacterized protein
LSIAQTAFYLPVDGGECFCLYRSPTDSPVSLSVLHLPAFGDEMNKSRAMTARASRAFAAHGCGVLQIDFVGCGDSAGNHADATFARWLENAHRALAWLRERHGDMALCLWSLRSGVLLSSALVGQLARPASLLLWQPVISGTQYVNHLLRQRLAASLLAPEGERQGVGVLRDRIRAGETLDIGGYAVSPLLAADLDGGVFDLPSDYAGRVAWLELGASAEPALSPAAKARIEKFAKAGIDVRARALQGPSFWQSVEIECSQALIDASLDLLDLGVDAHTRHAAVV